MPARVLWSIFEALVTALYLLQEGSAPPATRTPERSVLEPIVHRDIKPGNSMHNLNT